MSFTSTTDFSGPVAIIGLPQTVPVGFPFQQAADLVVLDLGATGSLRNPAAILTLGSDYTVTGGGYDGSNHMQLGSVIVASGGANLVLVNDRIVIMRGVAINQASSFLSTGPLTIALLEQALDKMATLSQQVNEITGRSLRAPPSEVTNNWQQPQAAQRVSSFPFFDANGALTLMTLVNLVTTGVIGSITAAANTVIAGPTSGPPAPMTVRALTAADFAIALANPSALVGTSAVNGSASTVMRSDAAPAINQAISPNWTGAHAFAAGSAFVPITVTGFSNTQSVVINGSGTAGQSLGLQILAGTNASDYALYIGQQSGPLLFKIAGDGTTSFVGGASVTSTGFQGPIGVTTPTGGAFTTLSASSVIAANGGINTAFATLAPGFDLTLGRAFAASGTASTGSIAIKDSTGTTYYLRVSTTP